MSTRTREGRADKIMDVAVIYGMRRILKKRSWTKGDVTEVRKLMGAAAGSLEILQDLKAWAEGGGWSFDF
jgi:hypothetical protein